MAYCHAVANGTVAKAAPNKKTDDSSYHRGKGCRPFFR